MGLVQRFVPYLAISLSLAATLVVAPRAVPAAEIPVRVETSGASETITFAWREPVAYQKDQDGNRVTIRFSRPIEGAFATSIAGPSRLVADARAGDDGRSVEMTLTRPAELFAFYTGTGVTIELVPSAETARAPAPAPPQTRNTTAPDGVVRIITEPRGVRRAIAEAQEIPGQGPAIGVRTGVHPDYTRIVMDFEAETPYSVDNQAGVVTLRIESPAQLGIETLNSDPVRWVGAVRSRVEDGATIVELAVPPTSEVRNFLSGSKIVLDVRPPTGGDTPVALPPVDQPLVEEQVAGQSPAAEIPVLTPAPPPIPSGAPAPVAQNDPAASLDNAAIPQPEATSPGTRLPGSLARALRAAPRPPGANGDQEGAEEQQAARPRPLVPETPVGTEQPQVSEEEVEPRAPAGPAQASATPGDDRLSFRFEFDEPVAAASFRRGGAIWIVFDTPQEVDTAGLQAQAGEAAFEILQMPSNDGTVLRIRTSRRYNPAVERDGLAWIIDFAERPLAAQSALEVNAQPTSPVGPRLFIPVPEPGRPIGVLDPNIGDNFVVIPVIPLGQAVGRQYTFPQFNLPPAAQGIVINPKIDGLRVRSLRQGVEISSSGVQMAISNVSADAAAHAQLAASRPMVRAIEDLAGYYTPVGQLRSQRRRYQAEVADAPDQSKTAARLQLARFYFANAYAAETLAVLRIAIEAVPLLEDEPSVRIMRGGANFLMGRYDLALPDFLHESLERNDEGTMWAAATTAMMGDRIGSARDLRFTGSIARDYPRALKMPLGILIAEVAAETGDGQGARLFLEALNLEDPTPDETAMLQFAEGKLMELEGDFEGAIGLWEQAIESENRPTRARAQVALTEMLLRLQRIDLRQAIEDYEGLRFAWRGDEMEFNNLRRLGSMYLDEGFYRDGLLTLKEAATHFREFPEAPEVTKQMSDTFNALFLGNQADELEAVKAIAIYDEFKELTPAGARGDEMIRNLADKLVEVDLLDRAAGLLAAQVQFRLEGEQKARVGARLALIYTLAQDYQSAFEVLTGTEEPNLPEALTVQRRHLRARTLMGLGQTEQALALLETDESESAELLRTEMFWNSGRWLEASRSLRFLVRLSGADPEQPLTNTQAARLMNYVISLTNSGGERAVAQVRNEFGFAMAQTEYAEAFQLVTAPTAVGVLDPNSVQRKVAEAETFLSAYRNRLKQGEPLSSIN